MSGLNLHSADFEKILSADEYTAYREFRNGRDESDTIPTPTSDSMPTKAYVDEQLQLAIPHLKRQLR